MTSRISSSVRGEDLVGVVAVDGDRAAEGEQPHGRGILPGRLRAPPRPLAQPLDLGRRASRRCCARPQPAEPQRAEATRCERAHRMADRRAHALDLALAPLVDASARARRARAGAPARARSAVVELDPVAQRAQRALARRAAGDLRAVGARHLVARMGQAVRQLAVVGQQDQAGGVGVEPADRVQARAVGHELDDRRAAVGVARGRDDAGRLVERVDDARLRARQRRAVDRDRRGLVDVAGRVGTTSPPTVTRPAR